MSSNVPINQLPRARIHGHLARAVDEAIRDDGLRVDAGQRLGGGLGEDGLLAGGRHLSTAGSVRLMKK